MTGYSQRVWIDWKDCDAMSTVRTRCAAVFSTLLTLMGAALTSPVATPTAAADACPDIQVVFARGTNEAPGIGSVGQAFVDALQTRVAPRVVDVYSVNYPATLDFPTAAEGVADASDHVREMAAACPKTRMVLGGFSQGAAVAGYVTADAIPPGYTLPPGIAGPMSSQIARHVAAVALFGEPSSRFLNFINAPPILVGSLYAPKTINQCIPDDPVCSPDGGNIGAHSRYAADGLVDQAAEFTAKAL